MDNKTKAKMMKPSRPVGIIGYGAYVPRYRLPASEVSRIWRGGLELDPIQEKSVPGFDEDVSRSVPECPDAGRYRSARDSGSLGWI